MDAFLLIIGSIAIDSYIENGLKGVSNTLMTYGLILFVINVVYTILIAKLGENK